MRLLMLPKCVLAVPKRGGKRNRGDRQTVSDLCAAWEREEFEWLWARNQSGSASNLRDADPKRALNAAVVHARQGRLGKACSLLSSAGIASDTAETRAKLESKHEHSDPPDRIEPPDSPPLQLSSEFNLLKVLRSFSKDVGTDNSNFRIQHLLDAHEAHLPNPILPRLRAVINLLLSGKAAIETQEFLAGARLTALAKPGGDVRPIAAGNILRRIASKCACRLLQARIRSTFGDEQLGVACRGGAEHIIHTMRNTIDSHWNDQDFSILKVDFKNAFNSVDRGILLRECKQHFPDLFPWVEWCYGGQPILRYQWTEHVRSCAGVQQGDPLGPMLFCLVLHVLVREIKDLCPLLLFLKWYLDDGTIAGPTSQVLRALELIKLRGPALGLNLNLAKCEVFSLDPDNLSNSVQDDVFGSLQFPHELTIRSTTPNLVLLGAPLGDQDFCSEYVNKLRQKNRQLMSNLSQLEDPQIALQLLRTCLSYCKYVYISRTTSPQLVSASLRLCDDDIRACLENIAALQLPDPAWTQAQLSISNAGLGLRSVSQHCAPAFISSHTMAMPDTMTPSLKHALDVYSEQIGRALGDAETVNLMGGKTPQRTLSRRIERLQLVELLSKSLVADQVRLNSLKASRSGGWLLATASRGPLDLTLTPDVMQAALQHRLGLPLAQPGEVCAACEKDLDQLGHHHLTCALGGFVVHRHNRLRDTFYSLCRMAGMNPELERGAYHDDASRPADVLVPLWSLGKSGAFDITVVSPLSPSILLGPGAGNTDVVDEAAQKKHTENDPKCADLGWTCVPLAIDSYGRWCDEAHTAFNEVAVRLSTRTKVSFSSALSSIYNSLSLVLVRQNALAIIAKRQPREVGAREVHQLSGLNDLG